MAQLYQVIGKLHNILTKNNILQLNIFLKKNRMKQMKNQARRKKKKNLLTMTKSYEKRFVLFINIIIVKFLACCLLTITNFNGYNKQLEILTKEDKARQKKLRRKANEKRQKNVTRLQLKMISPTDIALDQVGDDSLFNLKQIDKSGVKVPFILQIFFTFLQKLEIMINVRLFFIIFRC